MNSSTDSQTGSSHSNPAANDTGSSLASQAGSSLSSPAANDTNTSPASTSGQSIKNSDPSWGAKKSKVGSSSNEVTDLSGDLQAQARQRRRDSGGY